MCTAGRMVPGGARNRLNGTQRGSVLSRWKGMEMSETAGDSTTGERGEGSEAQGLTAGRSRHQGRAQGP